MQRPGWLLVTAAVLVACPLFGAKDHDADRINVIAHLPASSSPVMALTLGTHWQHNYLYVDHADGSPVTILDVTNPAEPVVTGQLELPKQDANASLGTVVGNAVLVTSAPLAAKVQTVTILSFTDPERPTVVRQFSGVTSMIRDRSRGLTYLANPEGIWVLRAGSATNVALNRQYENYVLYSH